MATPVSNEGLRAFDHLPPAEAVKEAWTEAGNNPQWHALMQWRVSQDMPVLFRALERLARDENSH